MSTKSYVTYVGLALCLVLAMGVLAGCKSKKEETPIITTTQEPRSPEAPTTGQPDIDLDSILFNRDSGLRNVYFDFDKSNIRADQLPILAQNAELIKKYLHTGVIIQVAGHCDERGTQEYNLALGERRALSVRDHLISLGIPGDRLVTISYGKEFPADPGKTEAAYAKNRRSEFNRGQR